MLKKAKYNFIAMLCSILVTVAAISLRFTPLSYRPLEGTLFGIGIGSFFLFLSGYLTRRMEEKNPQLKMLNEINNQDERNISIRNHAKAKASDVTKWLLLFLMFIGILANVPLYFTAIITAIYLLDALVYLYFINYYNKRM